MLVRTERVVPVLRSCLAAIERDDRSDLIRRVGGLTEVMAQLYAEPVRQDWKGRRVSDPGAGDVLLLARQLRASVAELPTHSGLGGIVWDAGWILALIDYLLLLVER